MSCVSARHVVAAADPDRYEVFPVGIDRNGCWAHSLSTSLALRDDNLPEALDPSGPAWDPLQELGDMSAEGPLAVFPLLHGPLGEDGTI